MSHELKPIVQTAVRFNVQVDSITVGDLQQAVRIRAVFPTLVDFQLYAELPQAFTVEDALLLTDFQDGLYDINLQDRWCMPLALTALACARFVRLPNPSGGRMYLPYGGREAIYRGQVVSLYAKEGGVGDFIVLDDLPDGDVYRLMLLNNEWDLGRYVLKQGMMVRVSSSVICPYRSVDISRRTVRYA